MRHIVPRTSHLGEEFIAANNVENHRNDGCRVERGTMKGRREIFKIRKRTRGQSQSTLTFHVARRKDLAIVGRLEGDIIGKECAGNTSAAHNDLAGAGPGLVNSNWLRAVWSGQCSASRVEESSKRSRNTIDGYFYGRRGLQRPKTNHTIPYRTYLTLPYG